jgi:hypothetical protein
MHNISEIYALTDTVSEKVIMDARARRAASSVGLIARKSRWRLGYSDNYGGFMLTATGSLQESGSIYRPRP